MNLIEEAFKVSLRFIKYRPRSKKEVFDKLKRKGFSDDVIVEVVSFLEKKFFLDDEEFARLWVNERLLSKGLSLMKIKCELKLKGISEEIIQKVLSEIEVDELENAFNFLSKKFSRVMDKNFLDKERLLRKLVMKGFSYKVSEKAVNKFLEKF